MKIMITPDGELNHSGAEIIEVVPRRLGQSTPDAAVAVLTHLHPTRTTQSGLYSYDIPQLGRGLVELLDTDSLQSRRVDEKVHMLEIERGIGRSDPMRLPETHEFMTAIQPNMQNPYIQILFGVFGTTVGTWMILAPIYVLKLTHALTIFMPIIGIITVGTCLYFILWRGIRRVSWWHEARSYVRRRGEPLPSDLHILA